MNIYLDIDQTLISGPEPAPHLEEFLKYVTNHHNCYWLTLRDKGDIGESSSGRTHAAIQMTFYVSKDKWEYLDKIKTAKWNAWRTEGINWEEDFIWLSDYIFPEEMKVLKAKGVYDSWFPINSSKNPNVLMDVINGLKNKNVGNAKEHMKRILHFDDEEMLTNMYEVIFKKAGFSYQAYSQPPHNSEELINLVLAEKPDCIIMDIIMPVMDGFTATEILKSNEQTKKIPLFFLTNMCQREDIEKGRELGAVDYFINANHTPSELAEKIKEYLEDPINYKPKFG